MNYVIVNPEKAKLPNHTYDTRIVEVKGLTTYIEIIGKGVPFPARKPRRKLKKAN